MSDKSGRGSASSSHGAKRLAINPKDIVKQKQTIKTKRNTVSSLSPVISSETAVTKFGVAKSFILFQGILMLSKKVKVVMLLKLQRSFHLWNRLCRGSRVNDLKSPRYSSSAPVAGGEEEGFDDKGRSNWNQQQYLALFAESEKVREQHASLRESSSRQLRELKMRGCGAVVCTWVRARERQRLRSFFDRWHHHANSESQQSLMQNQKLQLEVGMQRVLSEREVVKEAEEMCVKLKSSLICTLFFYKWRSCVAMAASSEERHRHMAERLLIKKEIRALREAVEASNRRDRAVLQTAAANGNDALRSLFRLERSISAAVRTHRKGSAHAAGVGGSQTA